MAAMPDGPGTWLARVREQRPLVHCITNLAAVEFTANVLLALGASPVMAHAEEEVASVVATADGLLLNLGTLDRSRVRAMEVAGRRARDLELPVVLDPVGAGAIPLRTAAAHHLIASVSPSVIRGNAGEVAALATGQGAVHGVDAKGQPPRSWPELDQFSKQSRAVIVATGPEDLATDGRWAARVSNGHRLATQVTATGCSLSAMIAAFAGVWASEARERSLLEAVIAALVCFGIAQEAAARPASGPGSFAVHLLDALASLTPGDIDRDARVTRLSVGVMTLGPG